MPQQLCSGNEGMGKGHEDWVPRWSWRKVNQTSLNLEESSLRFMDPLQGLGMLSEEGNGRGRGRGGGTAQGCPLS